MLHVYALPVVSPRIECCPNPSTFTFNLSVRVSESASSFFLSHVSLKSFFPSLHLCAHRHVEEVSFKTFRKQRKAAQKYGCDAASKISCAPIAGAINTPSWWHCGRDGASASFSFTPGAAGGVGAAPDQTGDSQQQQYKVPPLHAQSL